MDFNGYKKPSVPLSDVIHEFDLEVLNAPEGMEHILVESDDINRPGLQLTGFFEYFDPNHIQIFGNEEISYLERMEPKERAEILDKLFSYKLPALIISRSLEPVPECVEWQGYTRSLFCVHASGQVL